MAVSVSGRGSGRVAIAPDDAWAQAKRQARELDRIVDGSIPRHVLIVRAAAELGLTTRHVYNLLQRYVPERRIPILFDLAIASGRSSNLAHARRLKVRPGYISASGTASTLRIALMLERADQTADVSDRDKILSLPLELDPPVARPLTQLSMLMRARCLTFARPRIVALAKTPLPPLRANLRDLLTAYAAIAGRPQAQSTGKRSGPSKTRSRLSARRSPNGSTGGVSSCARSSSPASCIDSRSERSLILRRR